MTTGQCSSKATAAAPSAPSASTPKGSMSAGRTMSRRRGRRRRASTPAATQTMPTTLESSRLEYSIQACFSKAGRNVPRQSGQSGQPSPDPVVRTAAPEKTISTRIAIADWATIAYVRGETVKRSRISGSIVATRSPRDGPWSATLPPAQRPVVHGMGVGEGLGRPLRLVPAVRVEAVGAEDRHAGLLLEQLREEVRPVGVGRVRAEAERRAGHTRGAPE